MLSRLSSVKVKVKHFLGAPLSLQLYLLSISPLFSLWPRSPFVIAITHSILPPFDHLRKIVPPSLPLAYPILFYSTWLFFFIARTPSWYITHLSACLLAACTHHGRQLHDDKVFFSLHLSLSSTPGRRSGLWGVLKFSCCCQMSEWGRRLAEHRTLGCQSFLLAPWHTCTSMECPFVHVLPLVFKIPSRLSDGVLFREFFFSFLVQTSAWKYHKFNWAHGYQQL